MRELTDQDRLRRFMEALGREADMPARVYMTGGATAVLYGWRDTTVVVDIKIVPESDRLLRAIPRLKESLRINVELASPSDFIPVPPGWEERSPFIAIERKLSFHHFDLYAPALAKVERGHSQDLVDVAEMIDRALIDSDKARAFFLGSSPSSTGSPRSTPMHLSGP